MVTPAATDLLVVIYAPREIPLADAERVTTKTASRLAEILGGREIGRNIY